MEPVILGLGAEPFALAFGDHAHDFLEVAQDVMLAHADVGIVQSRLGEPSFDVRNCPLVHFACDVLLQKL
jgi:hypothetical protein